MVIAYLKEQGKSEVDNLPLHLMELEKEQTKPKVSGRKEITDSSRNKWERLQSSSKNEWNWEWVGSWKDKVNKSLARFTKKKREDSIKPEMKGDVTTDTAEIQRIVETNGE